MKNKQGTNGAWFRHLIVSAALALVLSTAALIFPVQTLAVNPSSGQVKITSRVNGPPPASASTITSPLNGDTFSNVHIPISGVCLTNGLIIRIIDNGNFVGSVVCDSSGNFSLGVDLFKGTNTLIAQEFDALDQQGPDSASVTVFYTPPSTPQTQTGTTNNVPAATQASQLHINFDPTRGGYTSCSVDQLLNLPFRIQGGEAPYAVNIDWGDNTSQLVSLKSADEPLIAGHTYSQAGSFQVTVTATDQSSQKSILEVAIVIDGKPKQTISAVGSSGKSFPTLPLMYLVSLVAILLFGYVLGKHGRRGSTPHTT